MITYNNQESPTSVAVAEKPVKSDAINETVKKVSKRIDLPRPAKKDKVEEPPVSPSDTSMSIPRKIKNAQKQRRQEEVVNKYKVV